MQCRHCNSILKDVFLDLGTAPPTNAYLNIDEISLPEKIYPLKLYVCNKCFLVQTNVEVSSKEIFNNDYAYYSSVSSTWLEHAFKYTKLIIEKMNLGKESFVLEIGSNDGYLLRNFVNSEIPCLGIEPAGGTAEVAKAAGVPVINEFFDMSLAIKLAKTGKHADLIIGNNVYAHVPNINDFTLGLKTLLKPEGIITLEFPHLLNLIKFNQFDTVYHEHYSYFSINTVQRIFQKAGLKIFDVEKLTTHGGSLRAYGCHSEDNTKQTSSSVINLIEEEEAFGLKDINFYLKFQAKIDKVIKDLVLFLEEQKNNGKKIIAYGAAAKGNTLLNYGKINGKFISFVCDAAPSKQGKYMPGNHIPILPPSEISKYKPDLVLILPWNLQKEIIKQNSHVKDWGGKFVIAIPKLSVI